MTLCAVGASVGPSFAQPVPETALAECRGAIERQRFAPSPAEDASEEVLELPPSAAELCPAATRAIAASDWGRALYLRETDDLDPEDLVVLAELAASYESTGPAPSGIRVDTLDAVLAAMRTPEVPVEISLWERFFRWLDSVLGGEEEESSSWLEDWLSQLSIPERILRIVVIAVGVVFAVATLVLVINELRAAGVLRRRSTEAARGVSALSDGPLVRSLADVRRAPLARQPGLLLVLVLDRLRRRVPIAASRTHRDLLATAAALSPVQRAPFARVVAGAERATFGGWTPGAADVESLLSSGEELLEGLAGDEAASAATTPPAAAGVEPAPRAPATERGT
jgi:hypothetical protein